MSLIDAASSIVETLTEKLDASKQIERLGQRIAIAAIAAGIAATGAVFVTLAAFLGLRNVLPPAVAALICGVALLVIALIVLVAGRSYLQRQEAAREAEQKAAQSAQVTEVARKVGEVAGSLAKENAGALVAAAFAFGIVKGLGPRPPKDE